MENDWLNRNASWSDMYLFKQFQNFNRDTLSSVTLVSVQRKNNIGNFSAISRSYKNDLIFKGERYILILFLENLMEDWLSIETLAKSLLKAFVISEGQLIVTLLSVIAVILVWITVKQFLDNESGSNGNVKRYRKMDLLKRSHLHNISIFSEVNTNAYKFICIFLAFPGDYTIFKTIWKAKGFTSYICLY